MTTAQQGAQQSAPQPAPSHTTAGGASQPGTGTPGTGTKAEPARYLPGVDPARIPAHVAIIMDGNGRWAHRQGMSRSEGHRRGAENVRAIVEACGRVGVQVLTLYSFSQENWKRPADEVSALMELCIAYCDHERDKLIEENIRVRVLGRREGMPADALAALDRLTEATSRCTGPTLCLAINYGGRAEIVDAARSLAADAAAGTIDPASIDEQAVADRLTTAGLPDPDLLIRTAGEMRVSNYLLWQISYAELVVSDLCWPDFGPEAFYDALRAYAGRCRRFGGVVEPPPNGPGDGDPAAG